MKSSGIKRGMAALAISALAVTGIPALAGTASAIPADEQVELAQGGPDGVVLFNDDFRTFTTLNDGTDSTVRLEAGGGDNVGAIRFSYSLNGGATWTSIATVTSRNDDGNFSHEWAVPASLFGDTIDLRAQDFTGGVVGPQDMESTGILVNNDDESVNLTAGTDLGYYNDCFGNPIVGLTGTTSETDPTGNLATYYHEGDDNDYFGTDFTTIEGGATPAAATGTFNSVLNISGYPFTPPDPTPPADPDHLTVVSEVEDQTTGGFSQDFETYTLREQVISTVTAVDDGTSTAPDPANITITVLDQFGQPIAGALVFNNLGVAVPGFTDGRGELHVTVPQNSGISYFFADSADPGPCNGVFSPAQGDKRSPNLTQTTPSAISITSNPAGTVRVGSSVTETITVKNGAGNPLVNETVRITRTGPGANDAVVFLTTNAQGQATYTFTCTQAGTANVNAAVQDPNAAPLTSGDPYNRSVNDKVVCGTPTPPKSAIKPTIKGKNVNGGQDWLKVKAGKANGAVVKIFKMTNSGRKLVAKGRLNANGVFKKVVKDKNGNKVTVYKAFVKPTSDTKAGQTKRLRLR